MQIVQKLLVTINCMQVTVLLEAAVVFIFLATDVTGVTEAICRLTDRERPALFIKTLDITDTDNQYFIYD